MVMVSTQLPPDQCSVCTISGVNDTTTSCHSSLSLEPGLEVTLLFNCSRSIEEAYTVTITRTIGEARSLGVDVGPRRPLVRLNCVFVTPRVHAGRLQPIHGGSGSVAPQRVHQDLQLGAEGSREDPGGPGRHRGRADGDVAAVP